MIRKAVANMPNIAITRMEKSGPVVEWGGADLIEPANNGINGGQAGQCGWHDKPFLQHSGNCPFPCKAIWAFIAAYG